MTPDCFDVQIKRLKMRFGEKAFDPEFVKLVGAEVSSMSNRDFQDIVDIMISTRGHTRPPLITEFKEARLRKEKYKFNYEVQGAVNTLSKTTKKLKDILEENGYNGCDSVLDAVNEEVFKNQIKKADQSDF